MPIKWLLRYLKGSNGVGLVYENKVDNIWLDGYVDVDYADYATDKDNKRFITSYLFTLNGCWISWKSLL